MNVRCTSPRCPSTRQHKYDLRRRVLITNFIKDRQSSPVFTSSLTAPMSRMWGYALPSGTKSSVSTVPAVDVPTSSAAVPVIKTRRVKSPRKIGSARTGRRTLSSRSMGRTESYKKAVFQGNQNLVEPEVNDQCRRKRLRVSFDDDAPQRQGLRSYFSTSRLLPDKPLTSTYQHACKIRPDTHLSVDEQQTSRQPQSMPALLVAPRDTKMATPQGSSTQKQFASPGSRVPRLKIPCSNVPNRNLLLTTDNALTAPTPLGAGQGRTLEALELSDDSTALVLPPSTAGAGCVSKWTQTSPPPKKRRSLLRRSSTLKRAVEKMLNREVEQEKGGLERRPSVLKTLLNKMKTSGNTDDTLTVRKSTTIVRTLSLKENRAATAGRKPRRAASMKGTVSEPKSWG